MDQRQRVQLTCTGRQAINKSCLRTSETKTMFLNLFHRNLLVVICSLLPIFFGGHSIAQAQESPEFRISIRNDMHAGELNGRLFLMLSTDESNEPRFQISDRFSSQQIFGIDVEDWQPGTSQTIGDQVFGFPAESSSDIPKGSYFVQALFHKYETFQRSDGHTVKLPMDRGEGQQWNRAPGNLFSLPVQVEFDPQSDDAINVQLDQAIPELQTPADTKYIKHLRIESKRLTEFWGRPMHLGAFVLLPEGYDENPDVKYPLCIMHGHFPARFGGFRSDPPDPDLEPEFSQRFNMDGYNCIVQQEEHDFFKMWTGPDFPRAIVCVIQHANPYYDDSYAVNSENLGPYGDALTYELIPEIEKQFRGIGDGWARCLYGGSTGGWEALAAQVLYPDEYNACYAACPDPIDFRAYTLINLYEDENAYYERGHFGQVTRPGRRNYLGQIDSTIKNMNHLELVLGTKGRSGQQWDIWQAVYSPCGDDGYPIPIWDKRTGKIDPKVAEHWRENYDLTHIMQRDWETLGPKLHGKVHIYVGDMDNYYLNNAVYLTEQFLKTTDYGGEVTYGDRDEHCWNGDPDQPNAISRLRYHRMFVPKFFERIKNNPPPNGTEERQRWEAWNSQSK